MKVAPDKLAPNCYKAPAGKNLDEEKKYVPPGSYPVQVKTGMDFWKLAGRPEVKDKGWTAMDLIEYNFRTRDPREINWYLYNKVGCRESYDGKNYAFSSGDQPGVVYLPMIEVETPITGRPPAVEEEDGCFEDLWLGVGAKAGGSDLIITNPLPRPGEKYEPPPSIELPPFLGPISPRINGNEFVLGTVWAMDRKRRGEGFQIYLEGKRKGLIVGGGAGAVLFVVTGLKGNPKSLEGYRMSGKDFNVSLGAAWSNIGKMKWAAPFLKNLVGKKSLTPEQYEKMWEIAKTLKGALEHDACSNQVQLSVVDLPAGTGFELSLFFSDTVVRDVFGHIKPGHGG